MLALAPSTTSKHMSILRQAQLVESDKQGRWIHYRLPSRGASKQVRQALRWVADSLEDDSQTKKDKTKLKKLLKVDKEALCRKQRS